MTFRRDGDDAGKELWCYKAPATDLCVACGQTSVGPADVRDIVAGRQTPPLLLSQNSKYENHDRSELITEQDSEVQVMEARWLATTFASLLSCMMPKKW